MGERERGGEGARKGEGSKERRGKWEEDEKEYIEAGAKREGGRR